MTSGADQRPTCFISYSWDSDSHKEWVRNLVDQLISYGIATTLDQYDIHAGEDVLAFMEKGVTDSDYVILVCTPKFKKKADTRRGGVGWETAVVTGAIFQKAHAERKFIPILREGEINTALPTYLKSKIFIDFRSSANLTTALEGLVRHIYETPLHQKPSLGKRPNLEIGKPIEWSEPGGLLGSRSAGGLSKPSRRPRKARVLGTSVFLNCPYDTRYTPLLRSLVFTTMYCGFRPRSVLEAPTVSKARLQRILAIMADCQFGIHDITLAEPDSDGLPRSNVPFELGVFQGLQRFGPRLSGERRSLILSEDSLQHQKYLSDISGMDVQAHGSDPRKLSKVVSNWLHAASGRDVFPPSSEVWSKYKWFCSDLPKVVSSLQLDSADDLSFTDFTWVISEWLTSNLPSAANPGAPPDANRASHGRRR